MRTTMSFIMAGLLLIAFASMSFAAKKNEKAWPNGIARPMPVPQWVQQQMNAQNEPLYHNNNFPVLPRDCMTRMLFRSFSLHMMDESHRLITT